MTASNFLENTLSTLTGLKFETLFLLSIAAALLLLRSTRETAAIWAASGKIPMIKLSLIAFVRGSDKIFADSLMSFGSILSTLVAFFVSIFFKKGCCYIRLCNRIKLKKPLVVFFFNYFLNFRNTGMVFIGFNYYIYSCIIVTYIMHHIDID